MFDGALRLRQALCQCAFGHCLCASPSTSTPRASTLAVLCSKIPSANASFSPLILAGALCNRLGRCDKWFDDSQDHLPHLRPLSVAQHEPRLRAWIIPCRRHIARRVRDPAGAHMALKIMRWCLPCGASLVSRSHGRRCRDHGPLDESMQPGSCGENGRFHGKPVAVFGIPSSSCSSKNGSARWKNRALPDRDADFWRSTLPFGDSCSPPRGP